ncbi:predicted protein [Nematostella vectensis]|uniref:Uncharacterized protein n=1 Tax=Nematostella vectensis TaxID=45351 RepID=A7RGY7_NEMVE|nr:uncharacterized protein LOC5521412 [Nematostella vectensis]EDO49257.1 predicted protein [Nematostella vectensis]|eukprot:XP_001641320.1 predicted protein [Nematostella vectensis]
MTIHIKYPKKKEFFSWEELGCLAKALGFQKTLFLKNTPPDMKKKKVGGLSMKDLKELLDIKALHGDIHRTYNMHDGMYNGRVIEKAAEMSSNRYLSFEELREVRVAFQLYEHEDMMGLVIDEQILFRTLKVCGRTVSPVKLMQHIKHMVRHVPDRLMLYEFLDLMLLCERDVEVEVPPLPPVSGFDRSKLYKICDFRKVLTPEEERKLNQLNTTYEQGLFRSHPGNKSEPLKTWREEENFIVDDKPRIEQVSRHQQRSVQLTDHLDHSNRKVLHARCGVLGITRTFVDLNDTCKKSGPTSRQVPAELEVPCQSSIDTSLNLTHDNRETWVSFASTPPRVVSVAPSPPSTTESAFYVRNFPGTTPEKLSRQSRSNHREILVTPRDVHNAQARIQNLHWDIETQKVRLRRKVDREMRVKHPRSHQIYLNRQRPSFTVTIERKANQVVPKETSRKSLEADRPSEPPSLQISPRLYKPRPENIYSTLKSRLQTSDTLLDFGAVEVPFSRFSTSVTRQLERRGEGDTTSKGGPNAVRIETLGSLPQGKDAVHAENDAGDVVQLLGKFQEANYVASGKKGYAREGRQEWRYTAMV